MPNSLFREHKESGINEFCVIKERMIHQKIKKELSQIMNGFLLITNNSTSVYLYMPHKSDTYQTGSLQKKRQERPS